MARRDFIANERNILAFTDNPFVVKLYYSFQSANNLYMVMEFLPGGDCFSLLRNLVVFPEVPPRPIPPLYCCIVRCVACAGLTQRAAQNLARHYVAELVHALGYLHTNGIVHRDLKVRELQTTRLTGSPGVAPPVNSL